MTKKIIANLNIKEKEVNFKKNKLVFCFLLFSSSKFVEFLLVKLNNFFIKFEFEKFKNKSIIKLTVSLENYIALKNELLFEFKEEELKFKFLYVLLRKSKLSVDFFENNYIKIIDKKEIIKNSINFSLINLIIKNIFFKKILFFIMYLFTRIMNNIKLKFYT